MRIKKITLVKHALLFFIIFTVVFVLSLQMLVTEKNEIQILDFTNMTQQEAIQKAKSLGLNPVIANEKVDYFTAEPKVLSQNLTPMDKVIEGRKIEFVVSTKPENHWQEKWIGKNIDQVQKHFEEHGVTQLIRHQVCSDDPSDVVQSIQMNTYHQAIEVLIADENCQSGWILKGVGRAEYIPLLEDDLRKKGITLRQIGTDIRRVHIDPKPGSLVKTGDSVVIREAP